MIDEKLKKKAIKYNSNEKFIIVLRANTFDEIDYNTLKVCVANLNSMVNDIRRNYL